MAEAKIAGAALRRVVFTSDDIARRVRELGREITDWYLDGDLVVIGLLKGSFVFASDLIRTIERPLQVDFLRVASYGSEKVSSGTVRLVCDLETELRDKHALVVEDIVDSGTTLSQVLDLIRQRGPRTVEVCTLLDKKKAELPFPIRFVGFTAPREFLVGYGLDHAENFRHLPYIASLPE